MRDKRALGVPRGVPPRPYHRGKNAPSPSFPVFFRPQQRSWRRCKMTFLGAIPFHNWDQHMGSPRKEEKNLRRASECVKVGLKGR